MPRITPAAKRVGGLGGQESGSQTLDGHIAWQLSAKEAKRIGLYNAGQENERCAPSGSPTPCAHRRRCILSMTIGFIVAAVVNVTPIQRSDRQIDVCVQSNAARGYRLDVTVENPSIWRFGTKRLALEGTSLLEEVHMQTSPIDKCTPLVLESGKAGSVVFTMHPNE